MSNPLLFRLILLELHTVTRILFILGLSHCQISVQLETVISPSEMNHSGMAYATENIRQWTEAINSGAHLPNNTTSSINTPAKTESHTTANTVTELTITTTMKVPTTTITLFPSLAESDDDEIGDPIEKLTDFPQKHIEDNLNPHEKESVLLEEPTMQPKFDIISTKVALFNRLKSLFLPSPRNNVFAHAMEAGQQFREKYGSRVPPAPPLYPGPGRPGYYPSAWGNDYSNYNPGGMVPDGAFVPIYKPSVALTLTADFLELNCASHGRIQGGIKWVKLVGLNTYGHELFATVADGERILFDTYHFGVRTDGKKSRLIIRNPDPKVHYGVYQCQVAVAGNPSIIVKEDFVVGKAV